MFHLILGLPHWFFMGGTDFQKFISILIFFGNFFWLPKFVVKLAPWCSVGTQHFDENTCKNTWFWKCMRFASERHFLRPVWMRLNPFMPTVAFRSAGRKFSSEYMKKIWIYAYNLTSVKLCLIWPNLPRPSEEMGEGGGRRGVARIPSRGGWKRENNY